MDQEVLEQVDRHRIVELACNLADIVSITGEEKQVAEYRQRIREIGNASRVSRSGRGPS